MASEKQMRDEESGLLTPLRRLLTFDERWRFILLFLVINLLIFVLIWLSWQNQVLVKQVSVLETQLVVVPQTRVVEAVITCEVDCTDKMITMAARQGERIAQVTATIGALITRFPTPATPTRTPAWTATPPPTFTPIPSPALPTPTSTATCTPTPTAIPTRTPKPPTPEPHPPMVWAITPTATVRSDVAPSFPVTITGEYFAGNASAKLGADIPITVTDIPVTTTILGKLPSNMSVGVYGLTVTNLDGSGQSDTLSPAFTVYSCSLPILESPFLVTWGDQAKSVEYQEQQIYFDVPSSLNGDLYIHIFDADTGDPSMVDDDGGDGDYSTTMTYTLSGSAVITTAVLGENESLDSRWGYNPREPEPPSTPEPPFFLGPFSASEGREVGDRRIFGLVVAGGSGNDANWYQVAVSTLTDTNSVSSDVRMFAYSWTGLVHNVHEPDLHLHPYVTSAMTMTLGSLGCASDDGLLWIRTPFRNLTATCSSGEGKFTPQSFDVRDGERGMTWSIDLSDYTAQDEGESLIFWVEDEHGSELPIFTRPTIRRPP